MDSRYIQILSSIDSLKRICPNMRLENVQILAVNGDEFGTQQVILTQDQPSIMISNSSNDNQIQQIVYQPPMQGQLQQSQTHYVIQDDETHQEFSNQQVYYTTEIQSVDNSNVIQAQLQQTNNNSTSQLSCDTIQQPVVIQQNSTQQQHIFVPSTQQVLMEHQQTTIQQQTQTVVQNQQTQQQTHIISTSPQQILQNHQVVMHATPVVTQTQEQQSHIMMARPQQRQFIYNTTTDQRIVYENPPPQNTQQHVVTQTIQQTQICPQNQILQQANIRTSPPQRILQHSLQQQRITNINQRMILNTDTIRQQISMVNNSIPRARQCLSRPRFRQNIVKTNTPRMLPHAVIRPQSRDNPRMARASQQCNIRQLNTMQIQHQLQQQQLLQQQQRKINIAQATAFPQASAASLSEQNDIIVEQQPVPQPVQQLVRLPTANSTVQRMSSPLSIQLPKKQTKVATPPTANFVRTPPPTRLPIEPKRTYTRPPISTEYNILDDLEDSITAAVVSKNPNPIQNQILQPTTININPQQQDLPENIKATIREQLNGAPCSSDQDKIVTLANGEKMTLAKYKATYNNNIKIQQEQQPQQQSSSITQNIKTASQRGGKTCVNRQLTKKIINNKPLGQQTQQEQIQDEEPVYEPRESARMLVILQNGEQRLITFTLPKDSCTVQELLEQVGVSFSTDTNIQCVSNPGADIEYVVTVGVPAPDSSVTTELFDNSIKPQTEPTQTMIKATPKELPTKIIPGVLAVCRDCGFCGNDHAKCQRCKRIFLEEPKQISAMSSSTKIKSSIETPDKEKKDLDNIQRKHQIAMELSAKAVHNNNNNNTAATPQSTPTRGRGRGRGRGRSSGRVSKHVEVEPVILTLSSDDEADTNSNDSKKFTEESVKHFKVPLACEPIIPEDDGSTNDMVRENVADVSNSVDSLYTSFQCRTIRIGTLKYTPTENVIFSAKGIRIIAPNVKQPKENIILDLQTREIIKLVAHFSKSLSVIFIFTIPSCSTYIRDSLQMNRFAGDASPYYNSTHRLDYYKKIILLMDSISEDSKSVIKAIFAISVLEEVSHHDANELLNRSKEVPIQTHTVASSASNSTSEDIRQILIYPPGKGGISINTEDYMCLAIDQYLNDIIIDFYLNYLKLDKLSDEQRSKTHIFSSFFYNRLTKVTTRQRIEKDRDVKLTPSQKRHERVKNWTKNVNIFDKDFVIIPINEQSHWFLAIICYPGLKGPFTMEGNQPVKLQSIKKKSETKKAIQIGNTTITPLTSKKEIDSVLLGDDSLSERDEAEADDSDLASDSESDIEVEPAMQPIKQPCILIFDSLAGASRSRVVATLRDYLTCEYKIKIIENTNHTFNKLNIPGHCVKVPQQNNFTDCGLYLLQYVEQFFKDPIKDYRLPIKQLNNWFDTFTVTRKREEISDLLKTLIMRLNPEKLPLPDIAFPTLNGTLVEQDISIDEEQGEAEFEEEEMGEEDVDDIEEEDELNNESTTGETEEESTPEKPKNGTKLTNKRCIEDKVKIDFVAKKTARLDDT